jgi:phosphoribosyl-ATP pyrophosphohydrolase/phosphoribosyl-AMP cyclohydrolase
MKNLNFSRLDNIQWLVPAIIQDWKTKQVLMLWFMNQESYQETLKTWKVTFRSRTTKSLWTKGQTSWNYLLVKEIKPDCDSDSLLIEVEAIWPTCHTGKSSCFEEIKKVSWIEFLQKLYDVVEDRKNNYKENSYTCKLFEEGLDRITQKFWEEAIETVIASKNDDTNLFIWEVSDLIFHLFVLLVEKWIWLNEIVWKLQERWKSWITQ